MAKETQVLLPDIGDFAEVDVIEVLVSAGDRVGVDDSLITLESDKATMEIPSPYAGVVKRLHVAVGDKLSEGGLILDLETDDETKDPAEPKSPEGQVAPASAAPGAPAPKQTGERLVEVRLPDIGDFAEVDVIEILVAPGDRIAVDSSLLTLESDKATMEIPSPYAGSVRELRVKVGDKVSRNDLLLLMAVESEAGGAPEQGLPELAAEEVESAQAPAAAAKPDAQPQRLPGEKIVQPPPVLTRPSDIAKGKPHASPSVRRFARELGVDLGLVAGSGPKGRILRDDVQAFVKKTLREGAPAPAAAGPLQFPGLPEVDFAKFGEIETRPLSRIKKLSGAHLHRCWLNVPHVTQLDEADITELEDFRKQQKAVAAQQGIRLTLVPFLLKACASALRAMPEVNSSLAADGENLIYKRYIHIGVAVDTPNGLVVPVVRDVDKKGVFELARELGETSARARDGKLAPSDLQGGCFSISSLGGIGGTAFTPIVNAPEVAILGVSRAVLKPVWDGTQFRPRLMLPLSLSYDHRVIDGAQGARFTSLLGELLSDLRRLLL